MANKRHKPEEIVQKLRQIDVLVGQGMQRVDAIREVRITEQTYYRWRKQYGGMVERFYGRIEDVLQSHWFHSGEDFEHNILRYVTLYNQQLPQSALASRTLLQAMRTGTKSGPSCSKNSHTTLPDVTITRKAVHELGSNSIVPRALAA
jgi:hypothetical protein